MAKYFDWLTQWSDGAIDASFIEHALFILVVIVGASVSWTVVTYLLRWIGTEHGRVFKRPIRALKFQDQEIIEAEDIVQIASALTRAVRYALRLMILSSASVLIFTQFKATRHIPESVWFYVKGVYYGFQESFLNFLPSFIFIFMVMLVTRFFLRLVRIVFDGLGRGHIEIDGFYKEWAKPTYALVRMLVVVFALVVVFPYLPGSNSPAFKGLSIFIGVLVSLGSTSAIANIIAGIAITYMRAFKEGDRVRIADTVGDIVEKTLLVTRIRTPKNVVISIPNAMVMSNHIVNYSTHARKSGVILHTEVTIGYDVPWRKVHELLVEASKNVEFIEDSENSFVLQKGLGDFSVTYELNVLTKRPRQTSKIYSQLNQSIQDVFNEAGVEILSPTYAAVRDGNHITIPEEHVPKDYQPGGFNLTALLSQAAGIKKN
jgi:small-conductance mechanosensitive channel